MCLRLGGPVAAGSCHTSRRRDLQGYKGRCVHVEALGERKPLPPGDWKRAISGRFHVRKID